MSNKEQMTARDAMKLLRASDHTVKTFEVLRAAAKIGLAAWDDMVDYMQQLWIIDGEWSMYHSMVATQDGWNLTQSKGLWEIVTTDGNKFTDNDAARLYVMSNEFNPDNAIYGIALNAIMVGNIRG